jgi:hypothetical protein
LLVLCSAVLLLLQQLLLTLLMLTLRACVRALLTISVSDIGLDSPSAV